MENYDPRRRQGYEDPQRYPPRNEERRPERERSREALRGDDRSRRDREVHGWLDYDRDYGRSESRYEDRGRREEPRYGRGSEGSSFSPDWSREGTEPLYSDDPYYSRNRGRGGSSEYSRGGSGDYSRGGYSGDYSRGEDRGNWDQRARGSIPREQQELAERSRSGDYYSPDWPYERSGHERDLQRSRDDEQQSHYRGSYRRSTEPFSYPGGSGYLYSESWTLHGPYAGRGPKGYKRSDQQIVEEACQRLERDGEIDATDIDVSAEDGILRLRGTVQDRRTKRRAEECVESVYGARDVMNELRVSPQGGVESQDSQASQGSQASQRSQSGRVSQSPQPASSTSTPASRAGSSSSPSEQSGEDKRSPKH
jgi:hypothetical protein